MGFAVDAGAAPLAVVLPAPTVTDPPAPVSPVPTETLTGPPEPPVARPVDTLKLPDEPAEELPVDTDTAPLSPLVPESGVETVTPPLDVAALRPPLRPR